MEMETENNFKGNKEGRKEKNLPPKAGTNIASR